MLQERINKEKIQAMRDKNAQRLGALRMVIAEIQGKEKDNLKELDQVAVIQLLHKMIKQRKDALQQFEDGNREDLAQQERFEIKVITEFLPAAPSDNDLKDIVKKAISSIHKDDATKASFKDMGQIMAFIKKELPVADMGIVSQLVKKQLQA